MIKNSLSNLPLEIPSLMDLNYSDPKFKNWLRKCERILEKHFGNDSSELKSFKKIQFYYWHTGFEASKGIAKDEFDKNNYIKGLQEAEYLLNDLLEEMDSPHVPLGTNPLSTNKISKIFVSHSSQDKEIVGEVIDLLNLIGVKDSQIFCTSFEGYGIELGADFLERIKNELTGEVLVIFILTNNYYASPISLCEMGATWVQTKAHIPIVVPPFTYGDIKGVIPHTQGLEIIDENKWNSLKKKLEEKLDIPARDYSIWETGRNKILRRIKQLCE